MQKGNHKKTLDKNMIKDATLVGNEKIERAIALLQQEPTPEHLAHTLTVLRRRMPEKGELIIALEPNYTENQFKLQTYTTADGNIWWVAFTSFQEETMGNTSIQSTFLTPIQPLFHSALKGKAIHGILLNPWNRTIQLDKRLLSIILGTESQN